MEWDNRKYKRKFPKKWNSDADSVLKAGSVLVEAKGELNRKSYSDLTKDLKLSGRTDQRLRKIGEDKRLYDPKVKKRLPDSWGTIEKISSLSVTRFQQLIDSGLLTSEITREEVERFKKGSSKTNKQSWKNWEKLVTIRVKPYLDERELEEILSNLSEVVEGTNQMRDDYIVEIEDHGLIDKVERRYNVKTQREIDKAKKEGLKWGKRICRHIVQEMKRKAPKYLKNSVKKKTCQSTPTWAMDEVNKIHDFDGLQGAFNQLAVTEITAEELEYDPDAGKSFYKKLVKQYPF